MSNRSEAMSGSMCTNAFHNGEPVQGTANSSDSNEFMGPHAMHGGQLGVKFSGPHAMHGGESWVTGGSAEAVGNGTARVGLSHAAGGLSGGRCPLDSNRLAGQALSTAEQRMEALKVRIRAKNAMICTDDLC